MKHFGKILAVLILLVNLIASLIMLFSAYSPLLIDPRVHPVLSTSGLFFSVLLFINVAFVAFWIVFYWKYAIFSILALLLCCNPIRDIFPFHFRTKYVPLNCIKVLSYNVMGFDGQKKDSTENLNPILDYIKHQRADIVCLQEYSFVKSEDKKHLSEKDIRKVMKKYPYYHRYNVNGTGVTGNKLALFSKFQILTAKPIHYKSDYNGSIVYELNIHGKIVTLINNHLESNKLTKFDKDVYTDMIKKPNVGAVSFGTQLLLGKLADAAKIRAAQADSVARRIAISRNKYIIVCGDFNDSPISYAHYKIVKNIKDAYTESGFGLGISYNQNHFYFRIDNIMLSRNLQSYNCEVDDKIKESDHYPIWSYMGPF